MSWTRIKLWGVMIGAIVVITACSPLGPAPSSKAPKVYLLQWEHPPGDEPTGQLNTACPTVLLSAPRAAPGYAGAGMAYMEEAHRIDYFAHHRWADSPARMLEPLLVHALETSGAFQAVVQAPTTARFELRLDTELLRLVQVFEPSESRVELEMRISLLDTEQQRVLVSDVLAVTEPATERTPYGGVIAVNKAVVRLLEEPQRKLQPAVEPFCGKTESAA